MPNPETPTKPETAPQQETGGGCQQEPCSAGLDAAIRSAAETIIAGFAANGRRNPDWIAEAERIIRREITPPIREAVAPMMLNPASPRVKKLWPQFVARAVSLLDSLPNSQAD